MRGIKRIETIRPEQREGSRITNKPLWRDGQGLRKANKVFGCAFARPR